MKKRTEEIIKILDEQFGTEYVCYLHYETAWQLLIATMLSAQCTDARVNIVTADLFQKYDTLEKFANADLKELEQDIKQIVFVGLQPDLVSFGFPMTESVKESVQFMYDFLKEGRSLEEIPVL